MKKVFSRLIFIYRQRLMIFLCITSLSYAEIDVRLGVDHFLQKHLELVKNRRVGLLTNHTGVNKELISTLELLSKHPGIHLSAVFCPEHGIHGKGYAAEKIEGGKIGNIPLYSLHGSTRRPSDEMLSNIDILIYDIQDVGCRSYTFATTLFYAMEACAKKKIPVIVFDRPNPLGGLLVDGPMLDEKWRSFIGYVNVPYCHGMTIGELAHFFNEEYHIHCSLSIIPMQGWKRWMRFQDTGLLWIPTSPHIPEADTPFYYASTGILGELDLVCIGIGYTLPFKVIGAPWIKADQFARLLNQQGFEGVKFSPFYFRPFYGSYKGQDCEGVLINITDHQKYRPLAVQYLLLGILKNLYPEKIQERLQKIPPQKKQLFCQASGSNDVLAIFEKEKYVTWKLIESGQKQREDFLQRRKKYLIAEYN